MCLNITNIKDTIMSKKIPFESEFILHRLTQKRLKELFDLKCVASEIQLDNLRLDNLAFDEKTNSFVIIEYKNEFNANVLNQAQDYYDLILRKPEDFASRLDNKTNINPKKTRVMIIGPEFSETQISEAKDNFELWKVTLFEDCKVIYENLKTNKIKTIKVDFDELKITENQLLEDKSEEMKELYFNLTKRALSEFDDLDIRHLVDAFSLKVNGKLLCVIVFLKSSFNIYLFGDDFKNGKELIDISDKSTGGNANYKLKYKSDDDLDYFMEILKQVYNQKKE